MASDWQAAFDLGARAPLATPGREAEETVGDSSGGRLRRLRERLSASRRALAAELSASVLDRLDDADWARLEEALILSDVGARTTAEVVGRLEPEVEAGRLNGPRVGPGGLGGLLDDVA